MISTQELQELLTFLHVEFPFPENTKFQSTHAILIPRFGRYTGLVTIGIWIFNPDNLTQDPISWEIAFDKDDDSEDIIAELVKTKPLIEEQAKEYFAGLKVEPFYTPSKKHRKSTGER